MEVQTGWAGRVLCCCCCRSGKDDDVSKYVHPSEADERTGLLRSFPPPRPHNGLQNGIEYSDNVNLWNEPFDTSHTECEEDMALFRLIENQEKWRPGSQEWTQLHVEINKIRQRRMDVQERWKVVLRGLGFIDEVESGIMSPISSYSRSHKRLPVSCATTARELFQKLSRESAIFAGHHVQAQSQRYLIMMERLFDLATAEGFVEAAIELYPNDGTRIETTDDEWG